MLWWWCTNKQTEKNNMTHTIIEPMGAKLSLLKAGLKMYLSGSKLRLTKTMTPKAILNQVGSITGKEYKLSKNQAQIALADLQELVELYKSKGYSV
jgi:hypothetical protein